MRFDFSTVRENASSVTVQPGEYLCRVAEVREGLTRDGAKRWSFRLEVAAGEHEGRTAAWGALNWNSNGLHRIKKVLEALGFDVSGVLELEPQDLIGLRALVSVVAGEPWVDEADGTSAKRNKVTYDGFRAAPTDPGAYARQQHQADLARATALRAEADALDARWKGKR